MFNHKLYSFDIVKLAGERLNKFCNSGIQKSW